MCELGSAGGVERVESMRAWRLEPNRREGAGGEEGRREGEGR